MNPRRSPPPGDEKEEVSASIETLHETGQRLEELTGGQVDTVANGDGRTFLLRHLQDRLRHSEAARQAAILKPLPAHIALLDIQGLIITVNEAWRQFTGTNVIHGPGHGIGVNYLEICDSARGDDSSLAHQVAEGIRSVLGGGVKSFSIEYPCHSPTEQRWFLLTVTPLADDHPNGAGVLHLNIKERKRGEEELLRFAAATDATADAIYLVDRSSMCFVHVNDAACRMQNQTREELLALEPWVALSTSRAELERTYDSVIAGGVDTNPLELLRRRKDGSPVWVELRRHAQHSGNRWMIFTLERDITERKRAEDALARVNRVLAVLGGVNSAIVRFHTRQELFDEVCRIAVDHGAFALAWIGLLDPVTLDVTAVSWAGKDAESLARMKATARSDLPEGKGAMGKSIRAKKPVFNNDITAEDRLAGPRRQECLKRGYRSLIALPLLVDGEVAGDLLLYAREPNFYNEDEIKLLSELAGNISFALEHISRQQKLEKLSRIHAVSSGINSILIRVRNRQELFQESCRIAVEDGQFPFAWIGALDPATQDVTPIAWAGEGAEELTRAKSSARDDVQAGKGAVGRAIRERRPVFNNDISARSFGGPRVEEILRLGFRSQITLPLFEDQTVAGTLTMYAREPNFFDEEELKLLTELAGDISFALANISRQQKLEKLSRIRAVSSEINAAIVRIHDREMLLREACRIAVEHGKFELVWVAALDQEKGKVQPIAWTGFSPDAAQAVSWSGISAARGTMGEAILTRKPSVRNDIPAELPAGKLRQEALQKGCRSTVCLPLVVEDNVVALIVLFAPGVGFFDEEELALLNEVAGNISFALEHIEKEEKIARLSRIQAVMSSINALIVRVRDRQELFDEACRIAVEHGGFGIAWIGLLDPATLDVTPVACGGLNPREHLSNFSSSANADHPFGKGEVGRALRARKVAFSNNLSTTPSPSGDRRKEALRRGYRSRIALPLLVENDPVGVIVLFAKEPDFFNDAELKLLSELAGDISFALEHIGKEEKIARLSRIEAVMSEINSVIVRVRDRQELFNEACRVAVEHGNFGTAWIGVFDSSTLEVVPVAWSGPQLHPAGVSARTDISGPGVVSRAIREKQPVFDNDIAAPSSKGGERRALAIQAGFRSMVALPFMVEGAVVGHLSLYTKEPDFFNEDELKLLSGLARDISFALANISRQQKLEKLSRIRAVSSEINAAIVRIRERKTLLEETCRIVSEHGKFEMIWIGAIDHGTQQVQPIAWTGFSEETAYSVNWASISSSKGTLGEAIRTRKPSVRNDIEAELPGGNLRKEALKQGCRSSVCLPFVIDDSAVAAIALFATGIGFFDEEELALLNEVAGNISFALEHIERENKIARLSRIQAVMGGMNSVIVRVRDRQELFNEACRITVEHGGFEVAWIGVLNRETLDITPAACAGVEAESFLANSQSSARPDAPLGQGMLGRAIREKRAVFSNDLAVDPEVGSGRRQEAIRRGYRSGISLPLLVEGAAVGNLSLFTSERNFFNADEVKLLNELAADISFALQAIEKQEKLEYLSYYDVLTGLPNRTLFVDRLSQQMRSRGGEQQMVALILLDLVRFRNINESLGHRGGDEILTSIAQRLGEAFHGKDYLARISSNGFGAIVRGMKDAASVVHFVESEVFSCFKQPFVVSDRELRVSVKAGIAMFPVDGESAEILFRNAESALQRVRASSDRLLFYAADMNAQAAHAIALETRLRKAVDAQQFVLHYQPKIELRTGRICGLEALIRWNDPATGLVPPMKFIPILEETGMILEVGMWALQQALSDHAKWAAQGLQPPRIAVNVSQIQLRDAGFVAMVANAARAHANGTAGLALEITESLFMENFEECVDKLKAIRDMGIEIAVDDFGTGYSSLSYISRLPVDALKIDRSFVVKMASDPGSMSIVSMVITLAHTLNLKVVAEGVETEEQSNMLKLLRCDEAQGYLFAKPLPGESMEALLRERSGAKASLVPVPKESSETRSLAPPPAG